MPSLPFPRACWKSLSPLAPLLSREAAKQFCIAPPHGKSRESFFFSSCTVRTQPAASSLADQATLKELPLASFREDNGPPPSPSKRRRGGYECLGLEATQACTALNGVVLCTRQGECFRCPRYLTASSILKPFIHVSNFHFFLFGVRYLHTCTDDHLDSRISISGSQATIRFDPPASTSRRYYC